MALIRDALNVFLGLAVLFLALSTAWSLIVGKDSES